MIGKRKKGHSNKGHTHKLANIYVYAHFYTNHRQWANQYGLGQQICTFHGHKILDERKSNKIDAIGCLEVESSSVPLKKTTTICNMLIRLYKGKIRKIAGCV